MKLIAFYNKIFAYILFNLFKLSFKLKISRLTRLIFSKHLKLIHKSHSNKKIHIWVFSKDGINEDIEQILNHNNDIELWSVSRLLIKYVANFYLPVGLDDNTYNKNIKMYKKYKDRLRNFWLDFFKSYNFQKPKVIFTANFTYYAEKEFGYAVKQNNIQFIALHKECLKPKGRVDFFKELYQIRGAFNGSSIFVYNNIERDLQIKANIINEQCIKKTGMPRLDRNHKFRIQSDTRINSNKVLIFGFAEHTGLPRVYRKNRSGQANFEYNKPSHKNLKWNKLFINFYQSIIDLARQNENNIFFLKLKQRNRDLDPIINYLNYHNAPDNIKIIFGGDPFNLLTESRCVIGFNSSALLEAVAIGLDVFVPNFDECLMPEYKKYIPNFSRSTIYCESKDILIKKVSTNLRENIFRDISLNKDKLKDLKKWLGNDDGKSALRVLEYMDL
jgi:hypothetical protein